MRTFKNKTHIVAVLFAVCTILLLLDVGSTSLTGKDKRGKRARACAKEEVAADGRPLRTRQCSLLEELCCRRGLLFPS